MATQSIQTGPQDKEPQKYLSHKTKNPNKNRCFYFTNPVGKLLPDVETGLKFTEKYLERQACKRTIVESLTKILVARKISFEKHDETLTLAMADMEAQMEEERNAELLNPAWSAYREEYSKSTSGRGKNKANEECAQAKKIIQENDNLKSENDNLKSEVANLKSENDNLKAQLTEYALQAQKTKPKVVKKAAVKADDSE
jgi:transposase-like protein